MVAYDSNVMKRAMIPLNIKCSVLGELVFLSFNMNNTSFLQYA